MLELIDFEFLMLCEISELAHIAYYNRDTRNAYVDHFSEYSEFKYCKPVRPEFVATLDQEDKETLAELILGSDEAVLYAYEYLVDCDEEVTA